MVKKEKKSNKLAEKWKPKKLHGGRVESKIGKNIIAEI